MISSIILRYVFKKKEEEPLLAFGKKGKPYLVNKAFYFNVSHSGEYVVCAVSDEEVGIDIEYKNASRIFNDSIDATKKWTMYESYIKLLGDNVKIHDDKEKIDCLTYTYKIENYSLCIACKREKEREFITIKEKDIESLV